MERVDVDELLARAEAAPIEGWSLEGYGPLPWDYDAAVSERTAASGDLLDLGTGGGEWLSALAPRPPWCVATEAWPANVGVAAAALRPLGIPVVHVEEAADNPDDVDDRRGRLPFRDHSFGAVAARHEAFTATEVARVLRPGGWFITQQVDHGSDDALIRLLGVEPPATPGSWLAAAVDQLETAGLVVTAAEAGEQEVRFEDVGAIVRYLRLAPWVLPGFTVSEHRARLVALQAEAPLVAHERRFLAIARKP